MLTQNKRHLCCKSNYLLSNVRNFINASKILTFRWEAAKAQFCTATVGMMGAVAALILDSDALNKQNGATNPILNTNLILAFSAGGFLHIAMVSILPDLVREKHPKEALVHFILILLGISVMGAMSLI